MSEDSIEGMDCQMLIDTWATFVADGRDKPVERGTVDPEIEEQRLMFERENGLQSVRNGREETSRSVIAGRQKWLRGMEKDR